ncbi:MAG: UDP-N-acetylglucosamine 1-carboxyvinyltransferase, partial [Bacteroidales bacterium]|nr:UDP-N-acetylglucosamine 1-carboxyvinyltransferase [Bacteroidales bacterium]
SGSIRPQGAKNEALQIICAVLLSPEPITISNIPDIRDVNFLITILEDMGVEVTRPEPGTCVFRAADINLDYLDSEEFFRNASSLRGSIMILGPMLARFRKGIIPQPGGDKIGRRRLDTHFIGLNKLGADFAYDEDRKCFKVSTPGLRGAYIHLDEASVTGTANVLMAAVMAEGTTTIFNAACEPYLVQLSKMLNRMGARISGVGSNLLVIEGVPKLQGTEHRMQSDMIEIGSFIGLAAMTQSDITLLDVDQNALGIIPETFRKLGIQLDFIGPNLHIPAQECYEIDTFMDGSILTIADAPWPGFTPDLISIALVTATQARGSVLIHQKMFESRLFFVDKLIDMGAQIILCDPHRATIIGLGRKHTLRGIRMSSPDIRAGVALLIAALSAQGRSVIDNIEQIDRGYQHIDARLRALGASIERKN